MYRIRTIYIAEENTHFDKDYYLNKHLPLAKELVKEHANVIKIDVEWDVRSLDKEQKLLSPCTVSIYLDSENDVADFIKFTQSEHALPLREDPKNYTNCGHERTIAEVIEA